MANDNYHFLIKNGYLATSAMGFDPKICTALPIPCPGLT